MLTTDSAIVLSYRRHNDKSSILQVYSASVGRMALLVYGNKYHPQALDEVELTYDKQPNRDMQTLKTLSLHPSSPSSSSSASSSSSSSSLTSHCIRLFVAEVLCSLFRHEMQDEQVYRFLQTTIEDIDHAPDPENAHLRFLLGVSQLLGIGAPEVMVPHNRAERQQTIRTLLAYIAEHVEDFPIPRSLDILTEIFD